MQRRRPSLSENSTTARSNGRPGPGRAAGTAALAAMPDFDVAPGEVFGLLGPNGAGKSTTIGMLTTTLVPTSGTARLAGFDVVAQPLEARRVASVVFQGPVVDRALTGRRNLLLHGRLWGVDAAVAAARIEELAGALRLAEHLDRPVGTYSGGQRRRLEIGRALVSQPRVLFADERPAGLDPRIRHELLDVIADLRNRADMTVLLTTHYLDEAQRLCDRIAIVHRGEIVALDRPAALLAGLGGDVLELRLRGPHARDALAALRTEGIAGEDAFAVGSTLTVPLRGASPGAAVAPLDRARVRAAGGAPRPPTLDDVY